MLCFVFQEQILNTESKSCNNYKERHHNIRDKASYYRDAAKIS